LLKIGISINWQWLGLLHERRLETMKQLTKRLGVLRKTWMLNQTSGNMFNERA